MARRKPDRRSAAPPAGRGPGRWLPHLPVFLLLAVAAVQIVTAERTTLTPWKGGGFGMFSTVDSSSSRRVHVFVLGAAGEKRVELPPDFAGPAMGAACLPTRRRLQDLANLIAARLSPRVRGITGLRIEVWRPRFHRDTSTLEMELLSSQSFDLPPRPPAASPSPNRGGGA